MAIKTSLAYGKNFHFYQEAYNNNYVYLELEDAPYDAGYRRVMIAIPIDVWETIRGLGGANLDLVNATDEELIRLIEKSVAERIAQYEAARVSDPEAAERQRFHDSLIFGAADEPRDRQLTRGIEYFKTERERQREVMVRISQHKIIDIDSNQSESHTDS
jgi:hypothetical protein